MFVVGCLLKHTPFFFSIATAVTQRNGYMLWLHRALHANASSPDLQYLWAELLAKVDRVPESAPHYQASVQLFMDRNRYKARSFHFAYD